ncbi:hypothetical protein WI99_34170 [Burkholderia cepacia]|nr:hypothetical protein WI99_34170 [Burkholderia cepacia]
MCCLKTRDSRSSELFEIDLNCFPFAAGLIDRRKSLKIPDVTFKRNPGDFTLKLLFKPTAEHQIRKDVKTDSVNPAGVVVQLQSKFIGWIGFCDAPVEIIFDCLAHEILHPSG